MPDRRGFFECGKVYGDTLLAAVPSKLLGRSCTEHPLEPLHTAQPKNHYIFNANLTLFLETVFNDVRQSKLAGHIPHIKARHSVGRGH